MCSFFLAIGFVVVIRNTILLNPIGEDIILSRGTHTQSESGNTKKFVGTFSRIFYE